VSVRPVRRRRAFWIVFLAFSFAACHSDKTETPALAGICALALQVNPGLTPAELRLGLVQTAWKTEESPVVNPAIFVEWARRERNRALPGHSTGPSLHCP
jgi:hypothetical protein